VTVKTVLEGPCRIRVSAFACALGVTLALAGCGEASPNIEATSGDPPAVSGEPQSQLAVAVPSRALEVAGPAQTASTAPGTVIDSTNWVLAPPFYAAGDEPYWRLDLADGWFVFKRSGLPEIEAPIAAPARRDGADVFESDPLTISIRKELCQTEGGGQGEASAVVTFDGIEFGGCAFGGAAGAGSAEAAAVTESLAAIDACLERLGEPAIVTAIYPREGGRTALGLRTRNGSLYECAAEAETGAIAFLDPIEPGEAGAWMTTRMRFLRAPAGGGATCADAEEVAAGDEVIGYLLAPRCKF